MQVKQMKLINIRIDSGTLKQAGHTMLVLGIGNILLQDEGIGIHIMKYLEKNFPLSPEVICLDGGTLSFTLAGDIEDTDHLLVLDAVELGADPGTLCCYENEAMDHFLGTAKRSAHEVGLLDLMDIARLAGHLPRRRALVGLQYKTFDWGEEPTSEVKENIPLAARMAFTVLQRWAFEADKGLYPHRTLKLVEEP